MKKLWIAIPVVVLAVVILFGLIQLVPYGRNHTNPAVVKEAAWDSPQTRELAVRACFDCHSNATIWPWYTNIAPFSWLIQADVDRGRRALNFSAWNGVSRRVNQVGNQISSGRMPPFYYTPLHPSANLTSAEKQQLITGLENSLK